MTSRPTVGCQLLVFGKKYSIEEDTDAILDCVAAAGYGAVEGGASDPVLYRRKLEERGLVFGGTHVSLKALLDPAPIVEYLEAVGGSDVCNSGLMEWDARELEDYREGIEVLNRAGRQLREEGIHLHYHNHAFEFEPVDGEKTGMDLLMEGLDFSVVDLCVDVAWVHRGGEDPAQYLLDHRDRIGYLHFKDHDGENWVELGEGNVDFAAIMEALPELDKVRWVMIEQDDTQIDPMESATLSRRYLKETFDY